MAHATVFAPYEETQFQLDASTNTLTVDSPWLRVGVNVDTDHLPSVETIIDSLSRNRNAYARADVQEFLSFFADLPVLHRTPRDAHGLPPLPPYESGADEILLANGPRQFIAAINPFDDLDTDRAFDYFPDEWQWDPREIADASTIPATTLYDPVSVYTAIRRKRLQFQIEHAEDAHELITFLTHMKRTAEPDFFNAMVDVLAQQYYVTGQCMNCLDPAIEAHPIIADAIRDYAKEERNHEKLILQSIRELSDIPTEHFAYMPEVKAEIEVIRYAAKHCALGFSALVSIMEGTVYPESDPVGNILMDSSKPEARSGVEAHFQINKRGNHTAIPERFAAELPPVTAQTVTMATRLAEATIRLDAGLAHSMYRHLLDRR